MHCAELISHKPSIIPITPSSLSHHSPLAFLSPNSHLTLTIENSQTPQRQAQPPAKDSSNSPKIDPCSNSLNSLNSPLQREKPIIKPEGTLN